MLPNKKIISFDIDGTLTDSKSKITDSMAELLKELMKHYVVVPISGGNFEQFKTQLLPPFDADKNILPFISNLILLPTSGSQRYEYDKEKNVWVCVDLVPLPEDVKQKATKLLTEVIASEQYNIPPNPKGEIIEDRITQLSFSALGQNASIEDKKLWDPDQKKRQKIKAYIEPMLPEVTVRIGGTTTLDILPKGFDKMVGLERLLNKMNIRKDDMLFVGDALYVGGNDYAVKEGGVKTMQVDGPEDTEKLIKSWIG